MYSTKNEFQEIIKFLGSYLPQENIILIKGNHDTAVKTCIRNIKIKLGGHIINIVHDPRYVSYACDFNIVSHVHTAWKCRRFKYGRKETIAINVV